MKRIVLSVAVLVGVAGCGPDCDRFCKKWAGDCAADLHLASPNVAQCIASCNDVGGDYAAFIGCVVDKSCTQLANGACQIPGLPPGIAP